MDFDLICFVFASPKLSSYVKNLITVVIWKQSKLNLWGNPIAAFSFLVLREVFFIENLKDTHFGHSDTAEWVHH